MEALIPITNGAMLALFTLILAWLGKGRFDAIERRLDRVEADIADLRREMNEMRRDFHTEMASLRRDFNQLVLALAPQMRPQTG